MSKDNRDRLEVEINRYLDGEISDSEFEAFLSEHPEGFDIESFRALKTRVEKIEEIYRQLEEPEVPEGYWDTFADRVDEKIGANEKSSVWERLLNIVLPARWPKVTYKYIGAVASVLLVFVIGRSILEMGADKYQPSSKSGPSIEQKVEPTSPQNIGDMYDESQHNDMALSSEERIEIARTESDKMSAPERSAAGHPIADNEKQPANLSQPSGKGSGAAGTAQNEASQPVQMELNNIHLSTNEYDAYDAAVAIPKTSPVPKALQMPMPATEAEAPKIITEEPEPVPPVKPEERELYEMFKMTTDGGQDVGHELMSKSQSSRTSSVGEGIRGETRVWKYDNWDLTTLRDRMKLYEKIISDSSYSSEAFSEYAEMRSSVAVLTRDSIDIYDAVNAIDTVLNYNKRIDKNSWMVRREQIESLRNSRINR